MGTDIVIALRRWRFPAVERGSAGSSALRVRSVIQCGVLILAVKLVLRTRGFGWTIKWLRRQVEAIPTTELVDLEAVKKCEYRVAMAGALYPGRALCLEQSLVLYYLLRRQGIPVRYCQGVQPHPFLAHAWIDYRGVPLNDVLEHVQQFLLLPDQLP